jgi:hypothetical protein
MPKRATSPRGNSAAASAENPTASPQKLLSSLHPSASDDARSGSAHLLAGEDIAVITLLEPVAEFGVSLALDIGGGIRLSSAPVT